MRALAACVDYDHWAREVTRLTAAICDSVCPHEEDPTPEHHGMATLGCFAEARVEMVQSLQPDEAPMRINLDSVAKKVADCETCSQLVRDIKARRHARKRWGVAKREVRSVARKMGETNG